MKSARNTIHHRPRQSRFVEIFRTTPVQTVCPNFYVLAHANGCAFQPQCSYCYLKSSLWHHPRGEIFTNVPDMLRDVKRWIQKDNLESYVLNTGNLSDSLCFEKDRPIMKALIDLFRDHARNRSHTLLLVTKGGPIECRTLLQTPPCPNVVISFSVNSSKAARLYETGAASPSERFRAAHRLKKKGWRIRIRIDPMISGFSYKQTFRYVAALKPERITLGTLRAEANLPRFTGPRIFQDLEPSASPKGLSRYPIQTRLALYRQAVQALRPIAPIGLCEETPEVWDALGLNKDSKPCNCCQ